MKFQLSTLIATLSVAFLVYAGATWIIGRKIGSFVDGTNYASAIASTAWADWIVVGVWSASLSLAMMTGGKIVQAYLRRKPGRCGCCGSSLHGHALRCHHCGTRSSILTPESP